ncbi:MAG: hypothetical protein H0W27_00240 [Actinobacteria bacterium]|nr:hypothetical protein [Actinomycetota bacterium]
MSRELFGAWGRELSDDQFARALAGLGVLIGILRDRGDLQPAPMPVGVGDVTVAPAPVASRERYELMLGGLLSSGRPLVWDLSPLEESAAGKWAAALEWVGAAELAEAWGGAVGASMTPVLEIHPVPPIADPWLLERLTASRLDISGAYVPLPEPEGRFRWAWPLRLGFLPDPASRALRDRLYSALPDYLGGLTEGEVGPSRCDVLVVPAGLAGALDLLERVARVSHVPQATCAILVGAGVGLEEGFGRVPELVSRLSGWGASLSPVADDALELWFEAFVRELSHDKGLAEAIRWAGDAGHAQWALLFAAPRLVESGRLSFAVTAPNERMMATAGGHTFELPAEAAAELGVPPSTPIRREAPQRFIRVGVTDLEREDAPLRRAFRAGGDHELSVAIGARNERSIVADRPFPVEKLPPSRNGHRLTVVFTEPLLLPEPLVETIELPPVGESDAARFKLFVPAEAESVEARIAVLHRGRILQTALLRGGVLPPDRLETPGAEAPDGGPAIRVIVEANIRPGLVDLDDRQRFDAAIVLNHDRDGRSAATLINGKKAAILKLDWARQAVQSIESVFAAAEADRAFDRKLDSEVSLGHLRGLAVEGHLLYQNLGVVFERTFGRKRLERIQVLSANPNSPLPLEVVYDLDPPARDAALCPNAERALIDGRCDGSSHDLNAEGHLDVVCPAGFWGITKVIERQAVDPDRLSEPVDFDHAVTSEPVGRRKTLAGVTGMLFAASAHVNDVSKTELKRVTASLKSLLGADRLHPTDTWKEWAAQVRSGEPSLLLLLAHQTLEGGITPALEINEERAGERRKAGEITEHYVNVNRDRPGPIVLLLGCDTAVPQDHYQSFVVQFRAVGASIVVGTLAPVLGRHAGRAAEALVEELQALTRADAAPDRGIAFGDVIRQIRRRLLARGILMSLCLTSYGDADWRLAPAKG